MKIDFWKLIIGILVFSFLVIAFFLVYFYIYFLPKLEIEQMELERQKQEQLQKQLEEGCKKVITISDNHFTFLDLLSHVDLHLGHINIPSL